MFLYNSFNSCNVTMDFNLLITSVQQYIYINTIRRHLFIFRYEEKLVFQKYFSKKLLVKSQLERLYFSFWIQSKQCYLQFSFSQQCNVTLKYLYLKLYSCFKYSISSDLTSLINTHMKLFELSKSSQEQKKITQQLLN